MVNAGYRCIVPDLMGFGLSDMPDNEAEHTLKIHVTMMTELINQFELIKYYYCGTGLGWAYQLTICD